MKESSSNSRSKSALGGKKSKSGKSHSHSIHVKRGKSGGFVVTHHAEPSADGMQDPPEDHVVPDMDALHQHLDASMGDQGPAPAAAPPQMPQGGAPGPQAAPAGM